MGHIVTVASSKGGVGKSVITTILSGNLAALGYRVAVIDADPNGSYSQWHGLYEGPPIDCSCEVRHEEIVDRAQALATRAVEADLSDMPMMKQHLSDLSEFGKLTLSGKVPVTGRVGNQAKELIAELKALGAVPAKRMKVAA